MGKLQINCKIKCRYTILKDICLTKNRFGILENTIKICSDCGEEFCSGNVCCNVLYDSFNCWNIALRDILELKRIMFQLYFKDILNIKYGKI